MIQHIIITIILAACILYAAFRMYKAWRKTGECKDFRCSGCAFYENCKISQKKNAKKFGGMKKSSYLCNRI